MKIPNIKTCNQSLLSCILLTLMLLMNTFFLSTKGYLNDYLSIVVPCCVISILIITTTKIFDGDFPFAIVSVIFFNVGVTMQVMVCKSTIRKVILTESIAFLLAIIGVIALIYIQKKLKSRYQITLYIGVILFLYVILIAFGKTINGTRAWISIGSLTLQLTEIIKLLSICSMAEIFSRKDLSDKRKILLCLLILIVNAVFMSKVHEIGTLIILGLTFLSLAFLFLKKTVFAAGLAGFGLIGSLSLLGGSYLCSTLYHQKASGLIIRWGNYIYSKFWKRFQILVDLDSLDPFNEGFQAVSARKALALSSWFGSPYKIKIPVAEADYVFTALILNMGLVFALAVLLLLLVFFVQGMKICVSNRKNTRRQTLIAGLICSVSISSILMILGSTNVFLVVGVPVFFLSNGGSCTLFSFFTVLYTLFSSCNNIDKIKHFKIRKEKVICRQFT